MAGTTSPTVVVGTSTSAWKAQTFFSLAGAVIDTQFGGQTNIWQVTVAGKSGNSNPFTSNPTSGSTTVTDGTVTWKSVASTHSGDAAWSASTTFAADHLIVANAGGTNSLFQLQPNPFPVYKQVAGAYVTANFYPHASHFSGQCELRNPVDGTNNPGSGFYTLQATANSNSVLFNPGQLPTSGSASPLEWATLSAAGDITGYTTPYSGATPGNYTLVVFGTLTVPTAGCSSRRSARSRPSRRCRPRRSSPQGGQPDAMGQDGHPWPGDERLRRRRRKGEFHITDRDRTTGRSSRSSGRPVPAVKDAAWVATRSTPSSWPGWKRRAWRRTRPPSKHELLRRVTYDLTGLPPTPAEVEAFLADSRPTPTRRSSTGCSPRRATASSGAGTGSTWCAIAETNSFKRDGPKPNAWRYRDYVIRAFNNDKPYDRFLREQLAGDELPDGGTPTPSSPPAITASASGTTSRPTAPWPTTTAWTTSSPRPARCSSA